MSQHSESSTIRYYDEHAEEYVGNTFGVDMGPLYQPFLELLPDGGSILDAGCGSGRDTRAFLDLGYRVTAIDASVKMVEATKRLTRQPVRQLTLQALDYSAEFDGIWACASLLHVPLAELDDVLTKFGTALCPEGVCYLSFKEGDGERTDGDRLFTDVTEKELQEKLRQQASFKVVQIWTTRDRRPGQSQSWVNALARKE